MAKAKSTRRSTASHASLLKKPKRDSLAGGQGTGRWEPGKALRIIFTRHHHTHARARNIAYQHGLQYPRTAAVFGVTLMVRRVLCQPHVCAIVCLCLPLTLLFIHHHHHHGQSTGIIGLIIGAVIVPVRHIASLAVLPGVLWMVVGLVVAICGVAALGYLLAGFGAAGTVLVVVGWFMWLAGVVVFLVMEPWDSGNFWPWAPALALVICTVTGGQCLHVTSQGTVLTVLPPFPRLLPRTGCCACVERHSFAVGCPRCCLVLDHAE